MKGLILAAGKGVRMRPLTLERPKVLIEVAGKPFLSHVIMRLKKAGIDEIGIIAGYKKEMIADFLAEEGIDAVMIEQKEQLGTGHAVLQAREWVKDDNFIVLMGDNLYSELDIKKLIRDDNFIYMFAMASAHPERYGVVVKDGDFLKEILEKPKNPPSDLVNIGLYKFTPEIFAKLACAKRSERGEIELTDAISELAKEGKVKVLEVEGYWKEMSTFDDLKKTEEFLLDDGADNTIS